MAGPEAYDMDDIWALEGVFAMLSTPTMEKELEWTVQTQGFDKSTNAEDSQMDVVCECRLTKACLEWMGQLDETDLMLHVKWARQIYQENGMPSTPSRWHATITRKQDASGESKPKTRTVARLPVFDACDPWKHLVLGRYQADYRGMESIKDEDGKVTTIYKFYSTNNTSWSIVGHPTFARTFNTVTPPRATVRLAAPEKNLEKFEKHVRKLVDKWQEIDMKKSGEILQWLQERLDPEIEQLSLYMDQEPSVRLVAEGVEFYVDKEEAARWSPIFEMALGPSGRGMLEGKGCYSVAGRWETLKDFLVLSKFGAVLDTGFPGSEEECGLPHGVDHVALFQLCHLYEISGSGLAKLEVHLVDLLFNTTARRDSHDFLELARMAVEYDLNFLKAVAFLVVTERLPVWKALLEGLLVWGLSRAS